MPLFFPVADSDYDSPPGAQNTVEELRLWVREMGYNDFHFKLVPGRNPKRISLYFWEGSGPQLRIAENLYPGEMVKFLNAWWLGFRCCNLHAKRTGGVPKEMPLDFRFFTRKKKHVLPKPVQEEVVEDREEAEV